MLAQLLCVLAVACGERADTAGSGTKTKAAPATEPGESTSQRLPNIVLFSIDTLRADHLGAYGYNRPTSPNIDAFAKEAVLFERAISQAPTTAPAHMSLFTGLTPAVHRVSNLSEGKPFPLDPSIRTFTELLREAGYHTVGLHGGGNVDGSIGFDRGFDLYSPEYISFNWMAAHRSAVDLDVIRSWIEICKKRGRPLFMFLHHYVCHSPYLSAPESYRDRYLRGRSVEGLPVGVPDERKNPVLEMIDRQVAGQRKKLLRWNVFTTTHETFWQGVDLARPDHRDHVVALYDSGVSYSDALFHQVMEILRSAGVYDETLVILLSDHGEEFHEHGGREHRQLFVETLHVPLLIKFPAGGKVKPRKVKPVVSVMDAMPTLFDYLGLPIQMPVQGRSLMPVIRGGAPARPEVVSYPDRDFSQVRLESGNFVYTNWRSAEVGEWLFDMTEDPLERRNLAADRPDLLTEMQDAAVRRLREDHEFGERVRQAGPATPTIDPKVIEKLRALGYVQ